jgi:hypothetical protein
MYKVCKRLCGRILNDEVHGISQTADGGLYKGHRVRGRVTYQR